MTSTTSWRYSTTWHPCQRAGPDRAERRGDRTNSTHQNKSVGLGGFPVGTVAGDLPHAIDTSAFAVRATPSARWWWQAFVARHILREVPSSGRCLSAVGFCHQGTATVRKSRDSWVGPRYRVAGRCIRGYSLVGLTWAGSAELGWL